MSDEVHFVECPGCRRTEALQKLDEKATFESAFRSVAIRHERNGCSHFGFGSWGFLPEWDKPVEPRWLDRGRSVLWLDKKTGCYRMHTREGER